MQKQRLTSLLWLALQIVCSSLHTGQDDAHGHCNQMLWILSKQHKNKVAAVKPILKGTEESLHPMCSQKQKRGTLNAISQRHSLPGKRGGEAEAILIGFLSFQTGSQGVPLAGLELAM